MTAVINPYSDHKAQLGLIEAGLKTLKHDKVLQGNANFSDMYCAVETHHRDLRLAHLTGKAKDLMEQAVKDTKFYNILIKMLCEIKRLPSEKERKETLVKVHNWYVGNRHTLATGPKFGKTNQQQNKDSETRGGFMMSRTPSVAKSRSKHTKSATSVSSRFSKKGKENKDKPGTGFTKFMSDNRDDGVDQREEHGDLMHDDYSSLHGIGDTISMNPPSEPASSRLSTFGNDFMTSRFMMDLPSSKLSWHLESPLGKNSTDWDGTEFDRVGGSAFSHPLDFHASHPSVPNSSPRDLDPDSPRSGISSGADVGSADLMEFQSDVRRHLSRGPTSGAGSGGGVPMSDEGSSAGYGLPKRMVHSIASMVNPHARLAETEAQRAEDEYARERLNGTPYSMRGGISRTQSAMGGRAGPDLSAHIPVLRAVSVTSNKGDNLSAFNNFRHEHLYGQDILSKLKFVGRSGTALDVRYSSHATADMPEKHTKEVIQLYGLNRDPARTPESPPGSPRSGSPRLAWSPRLLLTPRLCHLVVGTADSMCILPVESQIHNQSLEDFYQAAETFSPIQRARSRTQSAPAPRVKSSKMAARGGTAATTLKSSRTQQKGLSAQSKQNGVSASTKSARPMRTGGADLEDEVLYTSEPTRSPMKLEAVVQMIDHVKDEMSFFKEKLAPTPMAGFRQPASTSVSSKPLSRPGSTASRASRPKSSQAPRVRSPSPQGRPGTPTEGEDILMNGADVPADSFRQMTLPNRPHSATVNKAVDWRGKVTPEATRIKSKMRFGGHSYVQRLKPSLRTAGATSGTGSRPKTAPINVKERWNTQDKDNEPVSLPEVKIQNYPNIVTSNYPPYRVKQQEKPLLITITECEKNARVPQAASNTMTQVDDRDMDRIMSIQHLLGSSDSRYGSMGSLFLDEDFLRSFNARYTARSSTSHMTTDSQNREFLTFVAPTPRVSPAESRIHTRQSVRKPDVHQIDEEEVISPVVEETELPAPDTQRSDTQSSQVSAGAPPAESQEIQTRLDPAVPASLVSPPDLVSDRPPDSQGQSAAEVKVTTDDTASEVKVSAEGARSEVKVEPVLETIPVRDVVQVSAEDKEDGVHIEVTALPATGKAPARPADINKTLNELSTSETWHFKAGKNNELNSYPSGTQELDFNNQRGRQHPSHHQPLEKRRPYSAFDCRLQGRPGHWAKSVVKSESQCLHSIPSETMTTKVGRSAGRMPGGNQSPAGQVLRMSRRQNEYFKKAPPLRTPPSIPSSNQMMAKSPRQGQQYSTELEHHARKVNSPRHFMEHENGRLSRGSPFVELRKDLPRSAPSGCHLDMEDVRESMSVICLRGPGHAQSAPSAQQYKYTNGAGIQLLRTHSELPQGMGFDDVDGDHDHPDTPLSAPSRISRLKATSTPQPLAHTGRPIPQVSHIPDPDEEQEAAQLQREAKAAVDIQRIFRGFVCRSSYRKLLWDNRRDMEDKQQALMDSQREYRKHRARKAKILNRPPLDPALLQWAHDFKAIQREHANRRAEKIDNMANEMLTNQQEAKSKLEVIGPHVEIYDIYHPKDTGPSKRDMHKAAVRIQKHIRGFLVRKRFEKLRRKATFCGSTWDKLVKEYKQLLARIQRWHGVDKPTTPFSIEHVNDYMDMRRRYESQFDKKAFSAELELSELEAFFKECDLYPSKVEIDEGVDVITRGQSLRKGVGLKKADALNLLFYIYVPPGTGLTNTRQSTWMNPIINGVEARKLIDHALHPDKKGGKSSDLDGTDLVEGAPLAPCAELVIQSRRERREREDAETERRRREARKQAGETDSSDDEDEAPVAKQAKKKGSLATHQKNVFSRRDQL